MMSFRSFSPILGFLLVCQGMFGPAQAQSQEAATFSGQVTQAPVDTPLPGANVILRDPVTEQHLYGTVADSTGAFAVSGIEPDEYRLVVSFVGYHEHTERLSLTADTSVQDTISLRVRTLPKDEVLVTNRRAERTINPVTVANLTAVQVEERMGVKDLPALLTETPSTTFHSQNGHGIGYSTLRIRGFDQRRLAVSINGVPQNDPEDFNVFWVNLYGIEPSIEDVQVQRGAGSSMYGSVGIGGAINIVTDPFEPEPYARARVGAGSFNTRRLSVTGNSGLMEGGYVVNARFSRVLSDGYRRNSWTEFNRFFGGVARYGPQSTVKLQAFGGIQQDGLAFTGIPKELNEDPEARRRNPSASSNDSEWFNPPQVHLSHEWEFDPQWTLDQTGFWVKGEGYFEYGGTFRSADYLRLPDELHAGTEIPDSLRSVPFSIAYREITGESSDGDEVRLRGTLDQHQFGWIPTVRYEEGTTETTLGIETRLHRSLRWGRIEQADELIPFSVVGPEADHRLWEYRGEKIITSAFGSHLFRPERFEDRLAVQADLQLTWRRYRFYDEETFDRENMTSHTFTVPYAFANPRLGVTLNSDQSLSAYTSVALANREPRRTQLYDGGEGPAGATPLFQQRDDGSFNYDNPLITPERLVDWEFGGRLERRHFRLSSNLFWMEFWDEIVPSGDVDQFGKPRTGNADRTRHLGVELEGYLQLLPEWSVSGNLMLARTRHVEFTEHEALGDTTVALERDGNPIAASPEQLATVRTEYDWQGLTTALTAEIVGRQYVDNSGGTSASLDDAGNVVFEEDDNLIVDPYALLNLSLTYQGRQESPLDDLQIQVSIDNLLDAQVLRHGYQGATGPRFYPAAPLTVFVELRYSLP